MVNTSSSLDQTKKLLWLAFPMIITQLLRVGTIISDVAMSGYYSTKDLAGVSLGASLWTPIFIVGVGLFVMISSDISKALSKGKMPLVNYYINSYTLFAIMLSPIVIIVVLIMTKSLEYFSTNSEVVHIATQYAIIVAFSAPVVFFSVIIRGVLSSLQDVKVLTIIELVKLILNIISNYFLIYGKGPFPELGGVGCAISTLMLSIIGFIFTYLYLRVRYKNIHMFRIKIKSKLIKKITKIAFPNAFSFFVEVSMFDLISILVVKFGYITSATHNVLLSIIFIGYNIASGLANAVMVRLAFFSHDKKQFRKMFMIFLYISITMLFINALLVLIFFKSILKVYTDDPKIIVIGLSLAVYAVILQFFEGFGLFFANVLRVYNKTSYIFKSFAFSYWVVCLPLAIFIIVFHSHEKHALNWVWYIMCFAIILNCCLLANKTRSMVKGKRR